MTVMKKQIYLWGFIGVLVIVSAAGCIKKKSDMDTRITWDAVQDSSGIVAVIEGLSGPEAVRYDPDQDVYFISNFTGGGTEADSNGFISKAGPEGAVQELEFMTGTAAYPLHAPRGMYITGDTLWAADIFGVHGFNRTSGEQLRFIDFREFEPGFLNDIVQGADGHLYVTDTGTSKLFRMSGGGVVVAADSLPAPPNGITTGSDGTLVMAPWGGNREFYAFNPGTSSIETFATVGGGNFDGIEFVNNHLLIASQLDSSIHLYTREEEYIYIRVPGRPADIGIDTKRNRIAVPYIAQNRVDIWQLPGN